MMRFLPFLPAILLLLWINFSESTISVGALMVLIGIFTAHHFISHFIGFVQGVHTCAAQLNAHLEEKKEKTA